MSFLKLISDFFQTKEPAPKEEIEYEITEKNIKDNFSNALKKLADLRFYDKFTAHATFDVINKYDNYESILTTINPYISYTKNVYKIHDNQKNLENTVKFYTNTKGNIEKNIIENGTQRNPYLRNYGDIREINKEVLTWTFCRKNGKEKPFYKKFELKKHHFFENIYQYCAVVISQKFSNRYFGGNELSKKTIISIVSDLMCIDLVEDVPESVLKDYLANILSQMCVIIDKEWYIDHIREQFDDYGFNVDEFLTKRNAVRDEFYEKTAVHSRALFNTTPVANKNNFMKPRYYKPKPVNPPYVGVEVLDDIVSDYPKKLRDFKGHYKNLVRYFIGRLINVFVKDSPPELEYTYVCEDS